MFQVFDHLPHDLFQPFDVPVDIIVTPTQVIEVTSRLPRPKGILWNFVSDRRLQLIPVLKTLRTQEMEYVFWEIESIQILCKNTFSCLWNFKLLMIYINLLVYYKNLIKKIKLKIRSIFFFLKHV